MSPADILALLTAVCCSAGLPEYCLPCALAAFLAVGASDY